MKKVFNALIIVFIICFAFVPKSHAATNYPSAKFVATKDMNFVAITFDNPNYNNFYVDIKIDGKEFSSMVYDEAFTQVVMDKNYPVGTPYQVYFKESSSDDGVLIGESKIASDYESGLEFPDSISEGATSVNISLSDMDVAMWSGIFKFYAEYKGTKYYSYEIGTTTNIDFYDLYDGVVGGQTITFGYEDDEGNSEVLGKAKVKDTTPPGEYDFDVKETTIRDSYVKGTVEKGATVNVYIGNKKYSANESKGSFSVKIPKQKLNNKYYVEVIDASGNKSKKYGYTIQDIEDNGLTANDITYKTTIVKGTVKSFQAGDYIKIQIGKNYYTAKLNSSRKYSIKIPVQKANTLVYVRNYDSQGNVLDWISMRVYTTTYVKIGMTQSQVLATAWGKPNHINKTVNRYGTWEQWVYDDYQYLYFENGKLVSIDQ